MLQHIQKLRDYSAKCRRDRAHHGTALMLAALVVFVGVYDAVSTNASIAAGGEEANPLMATIQQGWGQWWFIAKLTIHAALAVVILWLPSRRMIRNARIAVALYVVVIASNFHLAGWRL